MKVFLLFILISFSSLTLFHIEKKAYGYDNSEVITLKNNLIKKDLELELKNSLLQNYKDTSDRNWLIIGIILGSVTIILSAITIFTNFKANRTDEDARKALDEARKYSREAFNELQKITEFRKEIEKLVIQAKESAKAAEKSKNIAQLMSEARRNYEEKDYDKSIDLIGNVIKMAPDYAPAYFHKGLSLSKLNKWEEAVKEYENAIAKKPKYQEAYNNIGSILVDNLFRYKDAIIAFDKAIEIDPNFPAHYYNKANALKGLNKFEEAIVYYDKALALDPKYKKAYNNKGLTLKKLGLLEDALLCFDKSLELKPNDPELYNSQGNTLADLGKLTEALSSYDKALDLKSKSAWPLINKGIVLTRLGRHDEALDCYNKAIEKDSKNSGAYYYKGILYHSLKKYEEALKEFDAAIKLDSKTVDPLISKANTLEKMGKNEEAIISLKRALDIRPDSTLVFINLGYQLIVMKRYEEAIEILNKGLAIENERILRLNLALALQKRGNEEDYSRISEIQEKLLKENSEDIVALAVFAMQENKEKWLPLLPKMIEEHKDTLKEALVFEGLRKDEDFNRVIMD